MPQYSHIVSDIPAEFAIQTIQIQKYLRLKSTDYVHEATAQNYFH